MFWLDWIVAFLPQRFRRGYFVSAGAAVFSGTVAVGLPGVSLETGARLAINTTAASVTFDAAGLGNDATLPAGPYLRLTGTNLDFTVAGVAISAATLDIERRTEDGTPVTRVTITDGTLALGDGTGTFLSLQHIDGFVVVGAGVMGLASARALARAGREPVVLEQFHVGHTHGSSHGATRIFRLAYVEPEWVRLAQEALPLWRDLEAESGEKLLELTGLVDMPVDSGRLTATLDATGTAYELLTAAELQQRFGLATTCDKVVFQADAGVVLADRAVQAFRSRLDVRVETEQGSIDTSVAVVATGAWARALLAAVSVDLSVVPTRETVSYFRLADDRPVPSVIDYEHRETYALTAGPGVLKVGVHRSGPTTDPDDAGASDGAIVRFASEWAARTFELAQSEPLSVETCLYTNTADASFVLERRGPIVVCSACSGHGFKFAPAVGRRVAELVNAAT